MSILETYKPEISVDCVVFGFDGSRLKVLLVQRNDEVPVEELEGFNNRKLPGSIILPNEDLDSAAYRILEEYTGLSNIYLHQSKQMPLTVARGMFDSKNPDKEFDIYVSVKLEGPSYVPGSKKTDAIYVDRVIFAE